MFNYMHGLKRYTLDKETKDDVQSPSLYNHLLWPSKDMRCPNIQSMDVLFPFNKSFVDANVVLSKF